MSRKIYETPSAVYVRIDDDGINVPPSFSGIQLFISYIIIIVFYREVGGGVLNNSYIYMHFFQVT